MLLFYCLFGNIGCSQDTIPEVLSLYNSQSVPYITVEELHNKKNVILLDAREEKEHSVSHIPGAKYVGYENFDSNKVTTMVKDKNATLVVYCSIGVRSEKIGEKLLKMGYTNVYNLYGGIFEWKNKGYDVVDINDNKTEKVHAYSEGWSKYLTSGIKIY